MAGVLRTSTSFRYEVAMDSAGTAEIVSFALPFLWGIVLGFFNGYFLPPTLRRLTWRKERVKYRRFGEEYALIGRWSADASIDRHGKEHPSYTWIFIVLVLVVFDGGTAWWTVTAAQTIPPIPTLVAYSAIAGFIIGWAWTSTGFARSRKKVAKLEEFVNRHRLANVADIASLYDSFQHHDDPDWCWGNFVREYSFAHSPSRVIQKHRNMVSAYQSRRDQLQMKRLVRLGIILAGFALIVAVVELAWGVLSSRV